MISAADLKLGKKLGRVEDPRTIMLRPLMTQLPVKVPVRHTVALNAKFPSFLNFELGTCGIASMGHSIIARERSTGQSAASLITDQDILTGYEAVGGYVPGHSETDNGIYLIDGLRWWRNVGLGREKDGTSHTIYAYARLDDPTDHDLVRRALWMFGGLYTGAALPNAAARQFDAGEDWDLTGNSRLDEWGSWGGHAMYYRGYGPDRLRGVTWGQDQFVSWNWWDKYVDEVWAIVTEDFLRTKTQLTPQGFSRSNLEEQLRAL